MPTFRPFTALCLSAVFLSCSPAAPRKDHAMMKTRIELDPGMPLLPSPDKTPRVALGTDIRLVAGIGNTGRQDLAIEDPKGTQHIMIHVRSPQDTTESSFLLNPSEVDALGEMTALPHPEVWVKPGSYAPFRFSLYKNLMDKCLSEGLYQVAFSYDENRSAPATLIAEFAPASVEPLVSILDDAGRDMWVRKEALKWLRRLKADFAYDFAKPDSRAFLAWWNSVKGKPDLEARFQTLR